MEIYFVENSQRHYVVHRLNWLFMSIEMVKLHRMRYMHPSMKEPTEKWHYSWLLWASQRSAQVKSNIIRSLCIGLVESHILSFQFNGKSMLPKLHIDALFAQQKEMNQFDKNGHDFENVSHNPSYLPSVNMQFGLTSFLHCMSLQPTTFERNSFSHHRHWPWLFHLNVTITQ